MDESESTSNRFLNAEELFSLRKPPPLLNVQVCGQKSYDGKGEEVAIQSLLEQQHMLLTLKRATRIADLMKAEWDEKHQRAIVDCLKGKLTHHMGQPHDKGFTLCPEETVFLMELGVLELSYGGRPLCNEEAYAVVLTEHLAIEKFRVYAFLSRQGFHVVAHQGKVDMKPSYQICKKRRSSFQGNSENAKKRHAAMASDIENVANTAVQVCVDPTVEITASEKTLSDENLVLMKDVSESQDTENTAEPVCVDHAAEITASEETPQEENLVLMKDMNEDKNTENKAAPVCVDPAVVASEEASSDENLVLMKDVNEGSDAENTVAPVCDDLAVEITAAEENLPNENLVLMKDMNEGEDTENTAAPVCVDLADERTATPKNPPVENLVMEEIKESNDAENPDEAQRVVSLEGDLEPQSSSGNGESNLQNISTSEMSAEVSSSSVGYATDVQKSPVLNDDSNNDEVCEIEQPNNVPADNDLHSSGELTTNYVHKAMQHNKGIIEVQADSSSSDVDSGDTDVESRGSEESVEEVDDDDDDDEEDEEVMIVAVENKKKVLAVIDLLSDEENDSDIECLQSNKAAVDDEIQFVGEVTASSKNHKKLKTKHFKEESHESNSRYFSNYPTRPRNIDYNKINEWPFPGIMKKTITCVPRPPTHLIPTGVYLAKEAYTLPIKHVISEDNIVPPTRVWNSYRDLQNRRNNAQGGSTWDSQYSDSTYSPPTFSPGPRFPPPAFNLNPHRAPDPWLPQTRAEGLMNVHRQPVSSMNSSDIQLYLEHANKTALQVAQSVLRQMTMNMPFGPHFQRPPFTNAISGQGVSSMPPNFRPWTSPFEANQPAVPQIQTFESHPSGPFAPFQNSFNRGDPREQTASPSDGYQQGTFRNSSRQNGSAFFTPPAYPSIIPKVRSAAASWEEFKFQIGEAPEADDDRETTVETIAGVNLAGVMWFRKIKPLVKRGAQTLEAVWDSLKSRSSSKRSSAKWHSERPCSLKVSFDVYLPSTCYKKSCPTIPHCRVIVMRDSDAIPNIRDLLSLQSEFSDSANLCIAVVSGRDVVFYCYSFTDIPASAPMPLRQLKTDS